MKKLWVIFLLLTLTLAGCAANAPTPTPTPQPPTAIIPSNTPRAIMLPTWTPSPTPPPKPTRTPRNTSTPIVTVPGGGLVTPSVGSTELLIDRPTSAQAAMPANLVTMEYDPQAWSLNSFYATSMMGYSLSSRADYACKMEPSLGKDSEGYQVEQFNRQIGTTTFQVTRLSEAGTLSSATYCTGEGEDATCYQVTPGIDHDTCIQATESVLATFQLIPNAWYGSVDDAPNHWICQDAAGNVGSCLISYSVPLNALAFTSDGQAWTVGDDGVIFHLEGQQWKEIDSPATHPLYDLGFASLSSGWAVGDGAEVLAWDGSAWNEKLPYHGPGEGPGGSSQVLYAVDAVSKDEAWMVGAMQGIDGKFIPYALHWNGADLVEETSFPECNCGLNAVLAVGKNDVFAVGGSDMGAMVFHWDGKEWSASVLPGADHLYSVVQGLDGTIWAGGIEVARDQSDTRGALFRWDGSQWLRVATPPLTGGMYALSIRPTGEIILGGDFTALRKGLEWQAIITDIAGYGWITDIEQDLQANTWSLTHSGNLFKLAVGK
jgi:hypothetical protein